MVGYSTFLADGHCRNLRKSVNELTPAMCNSGTTEGHTLALWRSSPGATEDHTLALWRSSSGATEDHTLALWRSSPGATEDHTLALWRIIFWRAIEYNPLALLEIIL